MRTIIPIWLLFCFGAAAIGQQAQTGAPAPESAENASPNESTIDNAQPDDEDERVESALEPQVPDPPGMKPYTRLNEKHQVWVDVKGGRVLLGAVVSCREGVLEMFACPMGTKEYESVLAVQSPAFQVHAALLAIQAKPGSTVQFVPEYKAATGPLIDVHVEWMEDGKQKRMRGQDFVKQLKTGEPMEHEWVFCGSGFWKDEETGEEYYHAEGGELICVSNFSTAMMDVTVESSQQNSDLMFGPFTENIPPLGTQVVIELSLKRGEKAAIGEGS